MTGKLKIELITGTACPACVTMKARLKTVIDEVDQTQITYQEIDVLEDLDYAVKLGVLSTPAIAIDGRLAFSSPPSLKRLRRELQQRLMARP